MNNIEKAFMPWIWCLVWLIIFTGLLTMLVVRFYESAKTPDCQVEYDLLSQQPPSSINSPFVIALGDSLLKHATPKKQWLNNNRRWYRANIPAAQPRQFFPISSAIEKIKPKLLLIQSNLLVSQNAARWDNRAKVTVRYLASQVFPLQTDPCNKAMDTWRPTIRQGQELLDLKDIYRRAYANSLVLPESTEEWLIQLQKLADKIIVVHFPRSKEHSSNTSRIKWLEGMKTELAKLDIEIVSVGGPQDNIYYRDGAHVNKKGRALRMKQLASIIESQL